MQLHLCGSFQRLGYPLYYLLVKFPTFFSEREREVCVKGKSMPSHGSLAERGDMYDSDI